MKYLYVLVSDDKDYYYEQALISITSLKIQMPDSFVSLLVDDITEKTLIEKRRDILDLIDELKVIEIESQFNKKARSRWLKTTMREHIQGDFLYIDCDTVIAEDLSEIESLDIELGGVPVDHIASFNDYELKDFILLLMRQLKFSFYPLPSFYCNGGVLFSKDTIIAHTFFKEWHRLWLLCYEKKVLSDQLSLNQANINCSQCIKGLDGKWNVQFLQGGLRYMGTAKIIHYFSSKTQENPYMLAQPFVFEKVRKYGITKEVYEQLANPRWIFSPTTHLISDKEVLSVIDFLTSFLGKPKLVHFLHSIIVWIRTIKVRFKGI